MRFRTKTILGIAAIEMALLAVLIGSALQILRDSNEEELTRRVTLGGKLLAAAAKDAVLSQDLATLNALVREAMASGQIDYLRILDSQGRVLAERGKGAFPTAPFKEDQSIADVTDGCFDRSTPILVRDIHHGEVRLGVSISPLNQLIITARQWAAGIAALEMALVALFSWLLGTYLARQLVALCGASTRIAAGDFTSRVPVQGSDELAETALAFNRMAEQLGESRQRVETESRQRLDALREAEEARSRAEEGAEQLKAIFDLSPDGFVSFDAERRVKYLSPAFVQLTGLEAESTLGLDEAAFSQCLAAACTAATRFAGVAALRRPRKAERGEPGATHERRQQIEIGGPGQRVLEIGLREAQAATVSQILYLRDITLEAEVDRLKSEFLSTAAHELRTPMASIYGFAELMLARDFTDTERREFLGTIVKQSELMVSIINELLDLARIEARRGKDFNIARLDLRELVHEIAGGFKPPDERPSPEEPPADGPLWVRGDRKKLTQAIGNVLSNAYKYSPAGGMVGIEFLAPDGDAALLGIRVRDQGIGMTEEQLARVFERFYRADASGKIQGTGLGMSIVKEIIELHGGHVELDSKVGAGTTVTIWLQAQATSAESATMADTATGAPS